MSLLKNQQNLYGLPKKGKHMNYDPEELEIYSNELLDTVSKNVCRIRKEKGFSQLKLSIDIGLKGAAYLGRMETREKGQHFNIAHLAKISKILKVDICEFFKNV